MGIVMLNTVTASVATWAWRHQRAWRLDEANSIVDIRIHLRGWWRNSEFDVLRLSWLHDDLLRGIVRLLRQVISLSLGIFRLND
jgi:hypothetical protein